MDLLDQRERQDQQVTVGHKDHQGQLVSLALPVSQEPRVKTVIPGHRVLRDNLDQPGYKDLQESMVSQVQQGNPVLQGLRDQLVYQGIKVFRVAREM